MPTLTTPNTGIEIFYEDRGSPDAEVILLVMGLGAQMVLWPDELVAALVGDGFRVIRYDNRDIGLSSHLDAQGEPNLLWQFVKSRLGLRLRSAYALQDMAQDALGILDALGVARAHVVGVSMGGMVSQRIAATVPERVLSLTSVMSSSGAPGLPGPRPHVARALLKRPRSQRPDHVAAHALNLFRLIGSPAFAQDMPAFEQRVLADAVRSLSSKSSETGQQMSAKVDIINNAITQLVQAASSNADQDSHSVAESENSIQVVLERFQNITGRLAESADLLKQESYGIRDEMTEVLVNLQFQDRVSQMLGHMRDDIEKLGLRLGETTQHIDARDWLDDLSHTYTTPEQHAIHHGRSTPAASSAADITFF